MLHQLSSQFLDTSTLNTVPWPFSWYLPMGCQFHPDPMQVLIFTSTCMVMVLAFSAMVSCKIMGDFFFLIRQVSRWGGEHMTYVKKGGQNAAENTVLYTPTVCPMDSDRVSLALSSVLYSAPPIPAGIFRNPQESTGMGPESTGMRLEWD